MASKTYIYRDMVSGCEMFSVAHPHSLMAGNDAVLCVQSAMINENGDTIDVGKDYYVYRWTADFFEIIPNYTPGVDFWTMIS